MVDVCLDLVHQDTRVNTHALCVIRNYKRFYGFLGKFQLLLFTSFKVRFSGLVSEKFGNLSVFCFVITFVMFICI